MLLDDISKALQLQYLSDLRAPHNMKRLAQWLQTAQVDAYTVQDWHSALEYLAHKKIPVADSTRLRAQLIAMCKQHGEPIRDVQNTISVEKK